uniref:Uncharacterized protein n=1 Tax=Tetranychus urticae TaxID=32264 RepID=T1KH38_TETUR
MLIPQQISIITVLFLAHCTLIVWSVSLTRSVPSESTSSNVNKTDKFVTLFDSKAKNISESQPKEDGKTFSLFLKIIRPIDDAFVFAKNVVLAPLELLRMAKFLLLFTKPGLIMDKVIEKNPLRPGPIKYFGQRANQALYSLIQALELQITSTLPTLVTNVNSSIPDNFGSTEWPRTEKVEPRGELSFPWRCFWDVFEKVIKARNSVVGTISRPFYWSTDTFFNGLETIGANALRLFHKTRKMFKSKCELDSSCELD